MNEPQLPSKESTFPDPVVQRFWCRVKKTSGCWLWIGFVNRWNYGRFRGFKGKHTLAHRFSWMIHKGPIPEGLLVLHRCDNPPCVNPDHLFLGTNADNCDDRDRKWRLDHKLSERQILQIRFLKGILTQVEIARLFNIDRANVGAIHRNETWKWVGIGNAHPLEANG